MNTLFNDYVKVDVLKCTYGVPCGFTRVDFNSIYVSNFPRYKVIWVTQVDFNFIVSNFAGIYILIRVTFLNAVLTPKLLPIHLFKNFLMVIKF